jgi:hypothetical protein
MSTATARIWITALYDQDDSGAIAQEALNMAKAERHLDGRGIGYHRQRLQNGTVDLSFDVPLERALGELQALKKATVHYGSVDIEGAPEDDPRIDALLDFDPDLIVGTEA